MKSKTTAGLLALLLGGIGVHKFYLGRGGQGILYLLFCWTFLPAVLGLIDAVVLLTMNDHDFHLKYNPGYAPVATMQSSAQPQNIVVNVANTASGGGEDHTVARLRQLHELKISGALTDEEYEAQKLKLLLSHSSE